jgi:hypothetical protein
VGALVALLALAAVALPSAPAPKPQSALRPTTSPRQLWSITLPDAAPTVPDGPHRAQFQAYCGLCHSPRLVLTQPRLSDKQWSAVVKKMVTAYKAPILLDQEADIVAYLMAIQSAPARGSP